jgi:ketosteroid isomerase-like protein
MQTHETVIRHLYESFKNKDYKSMAECYHADATFKDEAFNLKSGKEIAAMWHYLIESGKDMRIQFSDIQANETAGSAKWEAFYTFSRTGNKVHNIVDAYFLFKEGKIITHIDSFSFWRWAGMALGMPGKLLGWTPFLRNSVRKTARKGLDKFISKNPQYQ